MNNKKEKVFFLFLLLFCVISFAEMGNKSTFQKNDQKGMVISAASVFPEEQYVTGESMKKALLNTVLGISSVFFVLFLIYLVISSFSFLPVLKNIWYTCKKKFYKAEEIAQEGLPNEESVSQDDAIIQNESSDEKISNKELVAIITAAIAATTQKSEDQFIVRSIVQKGRRKKCGL